MLRFIKDWTLPIAMCVGAVGYPLFSKLSPFTPWLLFGMLLLTFSNIRVHELKPRRIHFILLSIQLVCAVAIYLFLAPLNKILAEAVMICVLCPTATAAAVITEKLGGSAASVTTYTLLINIGVAVVVPIFFPLIEPSASVGFMKACSVILWKVFTILICPFLLSLLFRRFLPQVHAKLSDIHGWAFYLWASSLTIVTAQIVSSLFHYETSLSLGLLIAGITFLICLLQFYFGKRLGRLNGDSIAGGQSFGQKNTILAIWMATAYLNPIAPLGPGCYVVWQNMVNSWQLWRKQKH
jgi:BASS family bile acid:Na+ symporter